jgi:hypothetical protein
MQFLYPSFLWALTLLSIPIIIHLFHFKRFKKVYFSNVAFLQSLKEETAARSKIKQWLILLFRLLAIAALVVAFAQPFYPVGEQVNQGRNAVSIYIDNSFSMDANTTSLSLLEVGRQKAREVLEAFDENDRFQIITNDLEGRHSRLVDRTTADLWIDEIEPSSVVPGLERIVERQMETLALESGNNMQLFLISDFQKSSSQSLPPLDSNLQVSVVKLFPEAANNVAIDSVWMDAPRVVEGQGVTFYIKVHNYGSEPVSSVRVAFTEGAAEKPITTVSLAPQEAKILEFTYQANDTGWQTGYFSITDYPVQFDDTYYVAFEVVGTLKVLGIGADRERSQIEDIIQRVDRFDARYMVDKNLEVSQLANQQLIVLEDLDQLSTGLLYELGNYLEKGGKVLFFPSPTYSGEDWNRLAGMVEGWEGASTWEENPREMFALNFESSLFDGVYNNEVANLQLPNTLGNFTLNHTLGEELITYRDGSPALVGFEVGMGKLYISAAPLSSEWSNLGQVSEILVPMLYKMAVEQPNSRPLAVTIGSSELLIEPHLPEGPPLYKINGTGTSFIPGQRILNGKVVMELNNMKMKSGLFGLSQDDQPLPTQYAFNFNRRESDLTSLEGEELVQQFPDAYIIQGLTNAPISSLVADQTKGISLWKWFLIFAAIFLLGEVLIIRFFRSI